MSQNPLIAAYKKPALYVSLPSGGKYYEPKPRLSADGELAVYPMTARDELITKTPDALFNGEATISLLNSCCPDIENPAQVPVSDLMVLMLAIRQASYGPDIDVDLQCPECNHINSLTMSATRLLGSIQITEVDPVVTLDNGFKVTVKPFNLTDRTKLQLQGVKQQRIVRDMSNTELNDEERNKRFGQTFIELAELTISLISNCIVSVSVPDSDESFEDNVTILEWLQSISKKDYDMIRERVEQMSEDGMNREFDATCEDCKHKWKTDIELDIANFFAG